MSTIAAPTQSPQVWVGTCFISLAVSCRWTLRAPPEETGELHDVDEPCTSIDAALLLTARLSIDRKIGVPHELGGVHIPRAEFPEAGPWNLCLTSRDPTKICVPSTPVHEATTR